MSRMSCPMSAYTPASGRVMVALTSGPKVRLELLEPLWSMPLWSMVEWSMLAFVEVVFMVAMVRLVGPMVALKTRVKLLGPLELPMAAPCCSMRLPCPACESPPPLLLLLLLLLLLGAGMPAMPGVLLAMATASPWVCMARPSPSLTTATCMSAPSSGTRSFAEAMGSATITFQVNSAAWPGTHSSPWGPVRMMWWMVPGRVSPWAGVVPGESSEDMATKGMGSLSV